MKEANERIQRIENACGEKLKRADRTNIIQDAKVQLCKQAFIKSSLFLALYNTEENLLIINSANKNIAGMVGAMLVKVIGSVKTVTINISDIKNGLTTRLKNHLDGEQSAFAGLRSVIMSSCPDWQIRKKLFAIQRIIVQLPANYWKV